MQVELNKTQEIHNCEHCEPAPRYFPQYENLVNDLHESYRQILAGQSKLLTLLEKVHSEVAYSDEEDDEDYEEEETISKKPKLSNFSPKIEEQGAYPGFYKPNLYSSYKKK